MGIDDDIDGEFDPEASITGILSPFLRGPQPRVKQGHESMSENRKISELRLNDANPRSRLRDAGFDELVASIKAQGILSPLLITPDGLVLAGNRRLAAAMCLKLQTVPTRVLPQGKAIDRDLIPMIENLVRSDLTPLDAMNYMSNLRKRWNLTATGISQMTGISASTVAQYLRIADGPKAVKQMIAEDRIGISTACALMRHADSELINLLSQREQVSYKEAQELIAKLKAQKEGRKERITEALPPKRVDTITSAGFLFYSSMVLKFIHTDLCDITHEQIFGRLKELHDAIGPMLVTANHPRKAKNIPANRSEHPALVAFKAATGSYPKRIMFDQVIETLGENPDSIRLNEVFVAWSGRGYNPMNLSWLEWYINGIPERNGNGKNRETASNRNVRNMRESLDYLKGLPGDSREVTPKDKARLLTSGS